MNIKTLLAFVALMSALAIYMSGVGAPEHTPSGASAADTVSVATPSVAAPPSRSEARRAEQHATARPAQVVLPPPADYEILYLGSEMCGYCELWKRKDRAEWRRDPARRAVRVREKEIETLRVQRGVYGSNFGRYQRTYERAFRDGGGGFPAFVMLNHGEIIAAGSGAPTWHRMVRVVRREAELIELRKEARRQN